MRLIRWAPIKSSSSPESPNCEFPCRAQIDLVNTFIPWAANILHLGEHVSAKMSNQQVSCRRSPTHAVRVDATVMGRIGPSIIKSLHSWSCFARSKIFCIVLILDIYCFGIPWMNKEINNKTLIWLIFDSVQWSLPHTWHCEFDFSSSAILLDWHVNTWLFNLSILQVKLNPTACSLPG